MARTFADSSQLPRPIVLSSVGILSRIIPLSAVRSSLAKHHRQSQRDRLLPAPFLVYLVIALSLYMGYALEEVLRTVVEGLRYLKILKNHAIQIATKGAISRARSRLGWEVMETLFKSVSFPLATSKTRGAWYHKWRLVALDGTTLSVPATDENIAAFGMHGSKEGPSAFPLVRLVTLVEVGTHAFIDASFDACHCSEYVIAKRLLPSLNSEMLLLEDRGFVGYDWWKEVRTTGVEVICRVRDNMKFPVHESLPDGSYLSAMCPTHYSTGEPVVVRVISYKLNGLPEKNKLYRIVTSILDHKIAPANELAALYHERWEIESSFDEFKTHIRGGAQVILRSKTPDLVKQEVYGLLLAHYVVRAVMHEAALQADEDPDKLSFIHAVRVLRRKLPRAAAHFSPEEAESFDERNN